MSLQIRRGTEGQRGAVTFDAGEIVFTTDTKKLYVGDGSTSGGVNVLASAAGSGLSWNNTTQQLDFAGTLGGFTTDNLAQGSVNKYYHQATAQADVAAMFIPYGTPTVTGNVIGVVTPNLVTLSSVAGLIALAPITITGTGGAAHGLPPGTYWITSVDIGAGQVTLSSTLTNAQASNSDVSIVDTHSVAGVVFTAGQGATATPDDSNIAFTYNPTTKTLLANVTLDGVGILSVSQDTSPTLGGNLNLNTHTINGTGSINFTGSITANGGTISGTTVNATTVTGTTVTGTNLNGTTATVNSIISSSITSPDSSIGLTVAGKMGNTFAVGYFNGTAASPTPIINGSDHMVLSLKGYTNIGYVGAGVLAAIFDAGATLTDNEPASTVALVSGGGGNIQNIASLDSNGIWLVPLLKTTVYSAAGTPIPSASTAGVGARAFVSDATVATFGTAYTGSGSNKVPVYSDGAVWRIG
jgi:Major tropism determinant N-terminal domain